MITQMDAKSSFAPPPHSNKKTTPITRSESFIDPKGRECPAWQEREVIGILVVHESDPSSASVVHHVLRHDGPVLGVVFPAGQDPDPHREGPAGDDGVVAAHQQSLKK